MPEEVLHITEREDFKKWLREQKEIRRRKIESALVFVLWICIFALIMVISFYAGRIYERADGLDGLKKEFNIKQSKNQASKFMLI